MTRNLPVAEFECGANVALLVNEHVAQLVVDAHRVQLQVLVRARILVRTICFVGRTLRSGQLRSVRDGHCGRRFVNFSLK